MPLTSSSVVPGMVRDDVIRRAIEDKERDNSFDSSFMRMTDGQPTDQPLPESGYLGDATGASGTQYYVDQKQGKLLNLGETVSANDSISRRIAMWKAQEEANRVKQAAQSSVKQGVVNMVAQSTAQTRAAMSAMEAGRITQDDGRQWLDVNTRAGLRQFIRRQRIANMVEQSANVMLRNVMRQQNVLAAVDGFAENAIDATPQERAAALQNAVTTAQAVGVPPDQALMRFTMAERTAKRKRDLRENEKESLATYRDLMAKIALFNATKAPKPEKPIINANGQQLLELPDGSRQWVNVPGFAGKTAKETPPKGTLPTGYMWSKDADENWIAIPIQGVPDKQPKTSNPPRTVSAGSLMRLDNPDGTPKLDANRMPIYIPITPSGVSGSAQSVAGASTSPAQQSKPITSASNKPVASFPTEAAAMAANLPAGTVILINGRRAVVEPDAAQ